MERVDVEGKLNHSELLSEADGACGATGGLVKGTEGIVPAATGFVRGAEGMASVLAAGLAATGATAGADTAEAVTTGKATMAAGIATAD